MANIIITGEDKFHPDTLKKLPNPFEEKLLSLFENYHQKRPGRYGKGTVLMYPTKIHAQWAFRPVWRAIKDTWGKDSRADGMDLDPYNRPIRITYGTAKAVLEN